MLFSERDLLPCPGPQSCQHNPQFLMELSRSVILNVSSTLASAGKFKSNNPPNPQNRHSGPSPRQKRNLAGGGDENTRTPSLDLFLGASVLHSCIQQTLIGYPLCATH